MSDSEEIRSVTDESSVLESDQNSSSTREIEASWGFKCPMCNHMLSDLADRLWEGHVDMSAFLEEYLQMRGKTETDDMVFRFIRNCTGFDAVRINAAWDRAEHKVRGGWFSPICKAMGIEF